MNIEDYRLYCLSLGDDVEEKMPFGAFKAAAGVLAFYVGGHIFSFFDTDHFSVVTLKCQPDRIPDLRERYSCVGRPYNESPRFWIGVDPAAAPDPLLRELTLNSYSIVKDKYTKKTSKP